MEYNVYDSATSVSSEKHSEEYAKLEKQLRKQSINGIIIGIILIVSAIVFTILGIKFDKPSVFVGVIMQLFAGAVLIINNSR